MNLSAITAGFAENTLGSRVGYFVELTKPRISMLVLFSVAAAGFAATGESTSFWLVVSTVVGTGLVAASATIGNQILETDTDARMARTAARPLPSGRISQPEAFGFMTATGVVGALFLALAVNHISACLGILTWLLYVAVYTPMKRHTSWNTAIGAIPGALPVLIGWAATDAPMDSRCASLFLILFLWQFPHFMAIAWMYRRDYDHGGLKMLTVTEPTGRAAGWLAVGTALALVPVSLWPVLRIGTPSLATGAYAAVALVLGIWQLRVALRFLQSRTDQNARQLLRASLVYLPLILLFFTFLTR